MNYHELKYTVFFYGLFIKEKAVLERALNLLPPDVTARNISLLQQQ